MDWTLEVVILPVSDLATAVELSRDKVGCHLDHRGRFGAQDEGQRP